MHYNLISIILIFNIIFSTPEIGNYLWPSDASETITTVFGDKRSRRFHAGIDVRTYGEIGDKLFAIESGYVSRISISPTGYGKALYLRLNDGNTAVYAHLDSYAQDINNYIEKYKKDNKVNFFDIYLKRDDFKVEKGEIIGFSGDTGSLSGGHLHFEIRDENGHPINPLKHFYEIVDTKKPIPYSLAFTPIDSSCYINGKQDHTIYSLSKYDSLNYFLEDTVSVIGNFGLAINVVDEIDNQPFSYGVYKIEAYIDDREIYSIAFEKYNMQHDPLIYNEIDYNFLTKKSKKYHRLYVNNNKNLSFIKETSLSSLNIDKDYQNLLINVIDNNNNKISIHGILKGDIVLNPQIKIEKNRRNMLLTSEENLSKHKLFLTNRYEDGVKSNLKYTIIDSSTISISQTPPPFNIIKYYTEENGIKSIAKFLSLEKLDLNKVNGKFLLNNFDNGILIQFLEDYYSGYDFELKIKSKEGKEHTIDAYRLSKTKISSKLLPFSFLKDINEIIITYKTEPEIQFSKKINGINVSDKNNYLTHNNYITKVLPNSFYNNMFLSCEDTNIVINNYELIDNPINLHPNNIPFKKYIEIHHENFDNKTKEYGIYSHNGKKWIFLAKANDNKVKAKIYSGGTFAILHEDEKPVIKNLIPASGATYKKEDFDKISFNCIDNLSGVDYNNIKIYLNNKEYFYDYIQYRKLVESRILDELKKGKHFIKIDIKDNLGNSNIISHDFYIQ